LGVVDSSVEIPKRALFKPAEVCEIASLQPYVLRSWESEFPDLGVVRTAGGPRVYRRADVERVLRIKQLVFGEGLTLAGARRRMGEDRSTAAEEELPFEELLGLNARERVAEVRRGLRSLLELLAAGPEAAVSGAAEVVSIDAGRHGRPAASRTAKAAKTAQQGSRKKDGTNGSSRRG
jgi:DNA-binding transcriptional MerR regulator